MRTFSVEKERGEDMSETANSSKTDATDLLALERRGPPRYLSDTETFCTKFCEDFPWLVRFHNISRWGAKLLVRCRFTLGTLLTIQAPSAAGSLPLALVVWTRAQTTGYWVLGCAFLQGLTTDQLRALKVSNREARSTNSW